MISHVLFDFDGTLVDSSEGILESLRRCLSAVGQQPRVELNRSLIGPPLRRMLEIVLDTQDPQLLQSIEQAFRQEYDAAGYLITRPYPDVAQMLERLVAADRRLHIVTNKRMVPTRQILHALGWGALFSSVNTLDTCAGARHKADVVAALLQKLGIQTAAGVFVGDTEDDANAASINGLPFAWARWGYGSQAELATRGAAPASVAELTRHLLGAESVSI